MYKKFVPLNVSQSPTKNPYEVRTYMGEPLKSQYPEWRYENCGHQRECTASPVERGQKSRVMTLEDEIRKIHQKTQANIFAKRCRNKCKEADTFLSCTVPQRSPQQLKHHAVLREKYLKLHHDMGEYVHDMKGIYSYHSNLVKLNSPPGGSEEEDQDDGAECRLQLASPECSMEMIYVPTQRILEVQQPKTGIYINESQPPKFDPNNGISYGTTYNPRVMQEKFNAQNLKKIDVIKGPGTQDLWTWNLGLQKRESELNRRFMDATVAKFDCDDIELTTYTIPQDLEKTFNARVVFGTRALMLEPEPKNKPLFKRPKEIACLYVAFVESFRLNADFWESETLDNILKMGEKLMAKSHKMNYQSSQNDFDILPQIVERQAEIAMKIHFAGPLKNEPNIYKALTLYFGKYNACVLCSKNLYLLIWKRCRNIFDVFDPNGRGKQCQRDFLNGKCSHISTNCVEHLVHLIVNISETNINDEFQLYEISLINFGKPLVALGGSSAKSSPKNFHKLWTVVNESYAVIPGCNNGLIQPSSPAIPNASMLISVMAILYSFIEMPKSWRPATIDDLIRLGTAYTKSLRRKLKLKDNQHLGINDLPDKYVLGFYKASMERKSYFYNGTLTERCKKFNDSLLSCGLNSLFHDGWDGALVQIDNSVMGIWKDQELWYLYDPFRRGKVGQVLDPEDYLSKGVALLQIHTRLDSLLRVLFEKAFAIRQGGKVFIHAIKVGCIKPLMDGKQRKLRYANLKLSPETYMSQNNEKDGNAGGDKPDELEDKTEAKKTFKSKKTKIEGKPLKKVCSIESLQDHERLSFFSTVDIVADVVDNIVGDIISLLPEPIVARPKLYKSAEQVLLRSDREYLEQLKYLVQHDQDPDNVNLAFATEPDEEIPMLTLEQELAIASNFQSLPDASWIVFGAKILPHLDEDQAKVRGLLSALVTACLTSLYKVSTWNSSLIDYAVNSAEGFGEDFQLYQYALGAVLSSNLPTLGLGQRTYNLSLQKIVKSDLQKSLRQTLLELLVEYNRFLIICQRFSCAIFKRYNFLYMFVGFPVNPVGYRHCRRGPACLLRFSELDSLIRRIEFGCNPQGCDITNFVVIPLKVYDVTTGNLERYRELPIDMEQRIYEEALRERRKLEDNKKSKLEFLENELAREAERLNDFEEAKKSRKSKPPRWPASRGETEQSDVVITEISENEDYESDGTVVADQNTLVPPKHRSGAKTKSSPQPCPAPRPLLYGYRLREKDYLYKIQGSKALEGRDECHLNEIKTCYFASTLAILYAILRPHNQWTNQRVDQVINSAMLLSDTIEHFQSTSDRIMKNVAVDEYTFDLWVKIFEPIGLLGDLAQQIDRIPKMRKHFILHTANCAYAIYKDEYYHLFDPYPSMHTLENVPPESQDEEEIERRKARLFKGIQRYRERNTASWILFADAKSMIYYIDQRCCSPTWKEKDEYRFLVVDIISYKKSPLSANVLQLLTGGEGTCNVPGEEEAGICAHNESIAWLEHCLPVWSRLNRKNTAGHYRGLSVSKFKKFDVEIENRLWSLWGNVHPQASVFAESGRGKQYLACCIMALCAIRLYRLVDWSSQLLDSIVINGDTYHHESVKDIQVADYEMTAEDLQVQCFLDNIQFGIHLEAVCYGTLYCRPKFNRMNLAQALMYFFSNNRYGILQCSKKCLAFGYVPGHDGGYFMFDCQSRDHPLFPKGQGAAYVLRTKFLQILLYCMVVTLNVPYYNVQFTLHKVETWSDNASLDGSQSERVSVQSK
ncbi:uncharacterized protein LOC142234273 [Haematobia irritans]|uniref:uncharacterized protein LOC142234273 n=1 Tax=Haematobia irritans TaxID=7368 RepID=UPI003F50B5C3